MHWVKMILKFPICYDTGGKQPRPPPPHRSPTMADNFCKIDKKNIEQPAAQAKFLGPY